ncbi:MAG: hypothetical protein ACKVK3_16430 [Acidimicrobiales bacterium]
MERRTRRSPGWLCAATVMFAGAWIVSIGYLEVAHAADPRLNGWWDSRSRIGDHPPRHVLVGHTPMGDGTPTSQRSSANRRHIY